ncbi:MAG TPA: hypothetical protein VI789_00460 [Dehalococcoidia bacterium]|nr:hypothetical protein [Dehalococcoidia bacterium]
MIEDRKAPADGAVAAPRAVLSWLEVAIAVASRAEGFAYPRRMLDDWDAFNANWLLFVSSLPYRAMAQQLVQRFPYLAGDSS